ncbi:hypothetical protein BpHYR1_004706 [Brachionus plicatilis]|uniref:Uncharacterized protein n=1 Tax=Brachionus plicatilis TaxID=10195 RepID=A0A3M7RPZ4_BRAPC|nr:hypothetical protein BpHYR1_004706 [Brachionus plicatilis]
MAVNELVNDFNNLNIQIGTVTMSQQDCPQLFINVKWRCIEASKAKCITDGEVIGKEYTVKFTHEIHNHGPIHKRFELMEKRRKIKESTKAIAKNTPNIPPRQIITKFNEQVRSKEAVALKATYDADRQAVNRYKKQVQPEYPPEPKKLSDIVIPDFLKLTLTSLDKNLEYYSNVVKLFEYLEETWIGRDVVKKTGRGRLTKTEIVHVKPMFEIELWNINSRINDCLPRTNNFVEAWHNAFSGMLCKHPSVYPLIDKFRYEQKKSEDLVVYLSTVVKYKRKPNYIVLDERIKEVVNRYSLDTFDKFYENLSLILDY